MGTVQQNTTEIFMTSYTELIKKYIDSSQGIKEVELVMKIMNVVGPAKFNLPRYEFEMGELVQKKEVIMVTYVLPHMDYREKAVYFPKGTKVGLNHV